MNFLKRIPFFLAVFSAGGFSGPAFAAELIVVEDRGGVSALPYYEAFAAQEDRAAAPTSSTLSAPSAPPTLPRSPSEAEAALLPVRSALLSPGEEPPRAIRAPGLTPIFLVGDDERSRVWLRERYSALREVRAVGLAVHVSSPEALDSLRRLVPDLILSPASGDDLASRLGLSHYPVLITATGIEP
ncbi:MAG: integrating conjugative element protein [Candidatus Accumulibacter sp.]|jgi:integrating conjugative element protein (TIGR03765 family)|nr:integrating conjugative element protein [Accumulibacter sp.]